MLVIASKGVVGHILIALFLIWRILRGAVERVVRHVRSTVFMRLFLAMTAEAVVGHIRLAILSWLILTMTEKAVVRHVGFAL